MPLRDLVKQTTTATTAATVPLTGTVPGFRAFAAAGVFPVGQAGIAVRVSDSADNWELGRFTLTSATLLTREKIIGSSSNGAAVNFASGIKEVRHVVLAEDLEGEDLSEYLDEHKADTATGGDLLAVTQGDALKGMPLSVLGTYVQSLFVSTRELTAEITASAPLDFTAHNRRHLICTSAVTISGPAQFGTVGEGFRCRVTNLSAGTVLLGSGITVQPSGAALAPGDAAEVFSFKGSIYAKVTGAPASSGPDSGTTTKPGQVMGLSAGAPTADSVPLGWVGVAGATSYKINRRPAGGTTWTSVATGVAATNYTVTGLAASTPYEFQVIATNSAGDGAPSATVSATTAASGGGNPGGGTGGAPTSAPFTATARGNFPTATTTGGSNYMWHDLTTDGAPTIAAVHCGVSTSNAVPPTETISLGTTPQGHWMGAMENYGGGTSWLIQNAALISGSTAAKNFYFWIRITDNAGVKYWFCHTAPILIGDGVASTFTTQPTPTPFVPGV